MSGNKALPKGLKDEEVERGEIRRPPIPYIPPEDLIQESVEMKLGTKSFKVTLLDGTIVYHKVYDGCSNKAFIIHVNYIDYYEGAAMKKDDCIQHFLYMDDKGFVGTTIVELVVHNRPIR